MKIILIKEVEILSSKMKITYDKTHNGGFFSLKDSTIQIGIKCIKNDPMWTLSIISHEIMEAIIVTMGGRFDNGRTGENYLFNFCHQTFENEYKSILLLLLFVIHILLINFPSFP